MRYPVVPNVFARRQTIDVFGGYNHNLRIGEGEFYDMENLSSDRFPVLSPCGGWEVYAQGCATGGLINKDNLCWVDGTRFVVNHHPVEMNLSLDGKKQLISMGAYVIILPDKKWINTLDLTQFGDIEAYVATDTDVVFSLCDSNGESYEAFASGDMPPENPENLSLWVDTAATPYSLKQYSKTEESWISVAAPYVKIAAVGIGKPFMQHDGITLSGIVAPRAENLNGSAVVWSRGDDFLVVAGILDCNTTQLAQEGSVVIQRQMPDMDFVVEAGNRLWGCRYGVSQDGTVVNALYASKLGDFKNWNCFMGIASDSWAAAVGTDGPFTGAITHLGFPLFFKEQALHKIYISPSGGHSVQDTACRGVKKGSGASLAIVNERVYYLSDGGVCVYDGSLPDICSQAFGDIPYSQGVAGAFGNKYYLAVVDSKEKRSLFVYDTAKGLWHRQAGFHVGDFCACRGQLFALDMDTDSILVMSENTKAVRWMAQTGQFGLNLADRKYISRLNVNMRVEQDSEVRIFARFDEENRWHLLCTVRGGSVSVPIRPRRCESMALRFEGQGVARIFAITKTIGQGSDRG